MEFSDVGDTALDVESSIDIEVSVESSALVDVLSVVVKVGVTETTGIVVLGRFVVSVTPTPLRRERKDVGLKSSSVSGCLRKSVYRGV